MNNHDTEEHIATASPYDHSSGSTIRRSSAQHPRPKTGASDASSAPSARSHSSAGSGSLGRNNVKASPSVDHRIDPALRGHQQYTPGPADLNSDGEAALQQSRHNSSDLTQQIQTSSSARAPKIVPIPSRPGSARDLTNFDYNLVVRQQPKQARLCSSIDKQPKGPVDPPPVVRLQISHSAASLSQQNPSPTVSQQEGRESSPRSPASSGTASQTSHAHRQGSLDNLTSASLIQSPYLFCFAALCKADEDEELFLLEDGKTRYITGNVVSSLYHLKDPKDGSAEGFFVFPDIGVRVEGSFRLKLSLFEMVDATVHHCKTVYTEPFHVYSPKRFPGVQDSTELSKSFASQGLKMRIKGGPARTGGKTSADSGKPGSSGERSKRPRTPDDHFYYGPDKRRGTVGEAHDTRTAGEQAYNHHFTFQPTTESENAQAGPVEALQPRHGHQQLSRSRPTSSAARQVEQAEFDAYPVSIDARARFQQQQHLQHPTMQPPRTAGPSGSSVRTESFSSLAASHSSAKPELRPITAPALSSPRVTTQAHPASVDKHTQTPYDYRHPAGSYPQHFAAPRGHFPEPASLDIGRPDTGDSTSRALRHLTSDTASTFSRSRHAYTSQYQRSLDTASSSVPPKTTEDRADRSSHLQSRYTLEPRAAEHLQTSRHYHNGLENTERMPPRSSMQQPLDALPTASRGSKITLPSISEMMRRPDFGSPSGLPEHAYMRTSSRPDHGQSLIPHHVNVPRRPSGLLEDGMMGQDDFEPFDEDGRYFQQRARQSLQKRPSI